MRHDARFDNRTSADLRRTAFEVLMNVMDLVIRSCKSVRLSSDLDQVQAGLLRAKRFYARTLINGRHHRLSREQVEQLELRSVRMEREIAKLEKRLRGGPSEPPLNSELYAERFL